MRGVDVEFDRQRNVVLTRGYPAIVGMSPDQLTACLEPLRGIAHKAAGQFPQASTTSHASFVVVVSAALARAEDLVPATRLAGGSAPGIVDCNHGDDGLASYLPLPDLKVPAAPVYLMVDVERGEEFCGVRPADALPQILDRDRTPLTIHEGIALVTQFPGMLEKNRCFMLAGSRRSDRRVPAMWISGKAPKLGWCWDGNPHSWLGTASAGSRVA
jgi:hypothetical protein